MKHFISLLLYNNREMPKVKVSPKRRSKSGRGEKRHTVQRSMPIELDEKLRDMVQMGQMTGRGAIIRLALERFFGDFPDPGRRLAEALLTPPKGRSEPVRDPSPGP